MKAVTKSLVGVGVLLAVLAATIPLFTAPGVDLPPANPLQVSQEQLVSIPGFEPGPLSMHRSEVLQLAHADGRESAIRVFYPDRYPPFPVIVFSPGFGSGKDQYDAVIGHWVSYGYLVIATDHADSGGTVSAIMASIRLGEMGLIESRIQDMQLLMDSLESLDGGKVAQLADRNRIVAAGHSFGAFIAQMMGGAVAIAETGEVLQYTGPPVGAVLAMSPPGEMFDVIKAESWKALQGPVLMTTGTWDVDARFWSEWTAHLLSFENAIPGNQFALVIDGADHYLGNLICRLDRDEAPQPDALAMLNGVTTAFLDAYMRQHPHSLAFMQSGDLGRITSSYAELRRR